METLNKTTDIIEEKLEFKHHIIRKYNTPNGEIYYASDVGSAAGIKCVRTAIKNYSNEEKVTSTSEIIKDIITTYRTYKNVTRKDSKITLLTRRGVEKLLCLSRSPNASDLAKFLNINVYNRFTPIETETIKNITTAFQNHPHELQYKPPGTSFRVDLYFPIHKVAVECDEDNHNDRNPDYENNRQSAIEKILDCKFIRYNPHDDNFNIFEVINKINIQLII